MQHFYQDMPSACAVQQFGKNCFECDSYHVFNEHKHTCHYLSISSTRVLTKAFLHTKVNKTVVVTWKLNSKKVLNSCLSSAPPGLIRAKSFASGVCATFQKMYRVLPEAA